MKRLAVAFALLLTCCALASTSAMGWRHGTTVLGGASAPTPTITKLLPNSGGTVGGTIVTITGTNLSSGTVKFGSSSATSVSCSSTSCTATSPAGSGSPDVTVTTSAGTSAPVSADKFTYGTFTNIYQAATLSSGAGATEVREGITHWILVGNVMPGTGGATTCSSSLVSYSATGGPGGQAACASVIIGNGFWVDTACNPNPISQGPQILALITPTGSFSQDATLNGTCSTPSLNYPPNSNFDVANALLDASFGITTTGGAISPAVKVIVGVGAQGTGEAISVRKDSDGTWHNTTWAGAGGAIRSFGTHHDSTTTNCGGGACDYLIFGNDNNGPYTGTLDSVSASTFTIGSLSEPWGNGTCRNTANCTNLAADWNGQGFYSGVTLTVTSDGATPSNITVSWSGQNLAIASVPTGTVTVSGFGVGAGGSGAANGNVSGATIASATTTSVTYTAGGQVTCGTGCTISPANFQPAFSQSPCNLVIECGNNLRVTGQADCGGTAFLVVQMELWKRVDGNSPHWNLANVVPLPYAAIHSASGLRGLTCVTYNGGNALLATTEGGGGCVWRFDPTGVAAPVCEVSFVNNSWSASYGINGYNNMVQVNGKTLIGEGDSYTPGTGHPYMNQHQTTTHMDAASGIWVRAQSGAGAATYTLFPTDSGNGTGQYLSLLNTAPQTVPVPPAVYFAKSCTSGANCSMMISSRTVVVSPFPTDNNQYVYFCGYDANDTPVDSTAWCDRVDTATIGGIYP